MAGAETAAMRMCPDCRGMLHPVAWKTVKHLLRYELSRRLEDGDFRYCADPECDVVYLRFAPGNDTETPDEVFRRNDIKDRARPNATGRDKLVCYCFGYTVGEIRDDADAGVNVIPGAIAQEVRAGNCACEVMNPSGH